MHTTTQNDEQLKTKQTARKYTVAILKCSLGRAYINTHSSVALVIW